MTSQHEAIGPAAIARAFCACSQVAKGAFVFFGVLTHRAAERRLQWDSRYSRPRILDSRVW